MRTIIKFKEQGFCYGVSRSIEIVNNTIKDQNIPRPIYLLGDLVHNHYVNEYCEEQGIIVLHGNSRLAMLDDVSTGTVIFTAHGVSEKVRQKAISKGLNIVDATCTYVKKTVENIKTVSSTGKHIVYIGKKNHPEVEAIVEDINDVTIIDATAPNIDIPNDIFVVCHQTTLSDYDVASIAKNILHKYPQAQILKQVCFFPEKRQQEILNHDYPQGKNLIIVVGDEKSNNVTKLVELAKRINKSDVLLVSNMNYDRKKISKYDNIFIASGTSTPLSLVEEIYHEMEKEND